MLDFQNSYLIILLAGVCFFLFGSTMASNSLEKLLAARITSLMNRVSKSSLLAISVGVALTTILQSSGAVTSMLVGLGTARVIKLPQVMGIIIGTAIGSTLTVQLISFDLTAYALPVFILAFCALFLTKKPSIKNMATVLIGFALIFMGIKMISDSAHYFSKIELLADFFKSLQDNSFYSFLAAMIFCAFVHSSAVTIGLAMGLASAGVISVHDAVLWVYGANIGTTSTALFAAAGSNYIGKQVAWAHFFYKVLSVVIFYPLTKYFLEVLEQFNTTPSRMIANSHFFFNIASAIIFIPFIKKGAELIEKMYPKTAADEFGAEFLSLNTYQNSALAISYSQREIMRMADIVIGMIKDSVVLFEQEDPVLIQSIKDRDNQVDFLYREIKMFLLDHANKSSTVVHQNIMNMIMFVSDLERAADSIDINIRALAIKKNALKLEFSVEGWSEIQTMHQHVVKVASMGINAYDNPQMCEHAIQLKRELAKLEISLRENHISRLNRGLRESINTSSIHLDLLSEYRRIASLICNHAYATTKVKPTSGTQEDLS
ncbi:MAG: Na/Pi-cotransporter family protein [Bdellovibrionales bacterium RIFCSPHIGHO2_01_FULL_40_29]|nr:MAG: Na/Pi-cotransporter family protein [Bdellovibrionales bacterium RIFCSPHIGHO2_01_FULL_40_29]OFZ34423.1 MAG: Na/Pi-cotransporter family protein [Bdellovibrionales bacterium RIFCSPHIGHO2_02_FULL_40_15]